MTKRAYENYPSVELAQTAAFVDEFQSASTNDSGVFDSVAAKDYVDGQISHASHSNVPEKLGIVLEELEGKLGGKAQQIIFDSLGQGLRKYEHEHGVQAPADLVNQAIHNMWASTFAAKKRYGGILDSAWSLHQDNVSLQPNRAVVSLLSIFGDPLPWGMYLPADIGSNEGKLAILSHHAGASAYGEYAASGNLDGVNSGKRYLSAKRTHTTVPSVVVGHEGEVGGKLTAQQTSATECDQGGTAMKFVRGRGQVFVNGLLAGGEASASGAGASQVIGSIDVGGTTYTFGGTFNPDTGVYALTTTPALPAANHVTFESVIDYEQDAALTPAIYSRVDMYSMLAFPWRAQTNISMDASTQIQNELGLDAFSEVTLAINLQYNNERHYDALNIARRVAANRAYIHDFAFDARNVQLVKSQIWLDFASVLGEASQTMAQDTLNHGITHLYVGKTVLSQWQALGPELWQSSGVAERPGIYRAGRLFGRYDVYYNPRANEGVTNSHAWSDILCVGRATDVARNMIVLGDAIPPTIVPLAVNSDLKRGNGFYARGFLNQNPHPASQLGAALITVANLT